MKKIILSILSVTLVISASAQKLDRSIRPKPGPAPEIKLGKTESFTLANGMKVFVVENHKLPVFSASIQLDIKPVLEGEMSGMSTIFSSMLESGTKNRSKEQLNKDIDNIGARVNASSEGIFGSGLKKHQTKILELMADITMNADFKQDELEKTKTRTLSELESGEDEPDQMLENVSAVMNFGTKHPYGEVPNKESVKKVDLTSIQKYYSTYFRPNVAYMAIVGDVTMAEVKPLIEKYFGKWEQANVPEAVYFMPNSPAATRVAFVPKEGAVQSVINVTYPIYLRPGNEDVIKARVANAILGSGSDGRLFLNLREKHGWTYGSYSSINQDYIAGHFTAYAKARNAVSDSSVTEILAEMNRMRNEPVSKEDLQNHINNMTGAFAIGLESPQTIAQYAINIERYKMPKTYYQDYLKNLAAVTIADVQEMAKKYIKPDNANIVVVGSKDDVAKKLARFAADGNVSYYDAYGKEIKQSTSSIPAGMTADIVMKNYINAIGGEKAIRSIKSIKTVMTGSLQGQTITITEAKQDPGKMSQSFKVGAMVMQKVVLTGNKGYQETQGQREDLKGDDLKEQQQDADIYADLTPEKYGIKRTIKSMDNINDKDVYVIEAVDAGGKKTLEYYNVADGFLVRQISTMESPKGAVSLTSEFSDYKEIPASNGYKIPYTVKVPLGPGFSITAKVETAVVNKDVDEWDFK